MSTNRVSSGYQLEIEEGEVAEPERIVIYGAPGVGKTTWSACAPRPFIIDVNGGSRRVNVGRNKKKIPDWGALLDTVRYFSQRETPYRTLVLDTLDDAEQMLHTHLLTKVGGKEGEPVASIALVGGGYGVGYSTALEQMRLLWGELERVRITRGMRIIVTAHMKIANVPQPDMPDFQRYELAVHEKISGFFRQQADVVLFAHRPVAVKKKGLHDGKRFRAMGGETRVVMTDDTPAWHAKNRLGLPAELPLSWDAFAAAADRGAATTLLHDTLLGRVETIAKIDPRQSSMVAKVKAFLAGNPDHKLVVEKLSQITARLAVLQPEEPAEAPASQESTPVAAAPAATTESAEDGETPPN